VHEPADGKIIEFERARFVAAADVEVRPVSWLWRHYIPLGKITMLEGDPNLAKTTIAVDISARVTMGHPMPDGSPCEAGSVLFIGYEDDAADTIVPRFRAAGGDDRHFFLLQTIYGPEGFLSSRSSVNPGRYRDTHGSSRSM
jgi:putative DNA primase/helicase